MVAELDLCPGYELAIKRKRGAVITPPDGGRVRARQRNERHLRDFSLTWKNPDRALFRQLLQAFRDANGTTSAFTLTLPDGEEVDACFNAPPRRTHGNAGRGRVELELGEVR